MTIMPAVLRRQRGGRQEAPPTEREQCAERDHLPLADELADKERLRAEGDLQEEPAVERITNRAAERNAEREAPLTKRREDRGFNRLADREGDHARDGDLLKSRPA